MKKLIYSTLGLILAGSLILAGCKSKDDNNGGGGVTPTPETPKPVITFLNTAGYTFTNVTVVNSSTIKFGMVVTSTIDLKSVKVTRNFNGSGEVIMLDSALSGGPKTFTKDITMTLDGVNKGGYIFTFSATDKDATLGESKITVTATGPLIEILDQKIYNNSGTGFGGYDLILGETISNADATNVARRDIRDNNTTQLNNGTWISSNGTKFVKNPPTVTWGQTLTEVQVKDAYEKNIGIESTTVTGLDGALGTLVIAKVTRAGTTKYYMIRITDVFDDPGANNDYVSFDYKY